ncbi:MAG: 3-hydroxyacyl-CoA dehydrogenase family protein [Syntrophales bacterium]|nr:3-hydroxyacyl-CoA dehydrogenase family protein [Syntrophales bacterium]
MKIDDLKNVCVVGAGNMGHQISLQCALSGFKTVCTDVVPAVLEKAEKFVDNYLAGRVQKGKMTEDAAKAARANISFTGDLQEAVKDVDLVIEAVLERIDLKRKIFADLDKLAPAKAILATNSSFIVSSRIADVTNRSSQVCNLHFFNPALVMKLVEVVQGPHVSDETAKCMMDFCLKIDKVPILIKKEVDGFVLNRIFSVIAKEALWMLEMGVASYEDIDKACVYGAGHPMGPFRLNDLTGIDLTYDICMGRFYASGNPADLPTPSVVKKVAEGKLGQKTGEGWYSYKR